MPNRDPSTGRFLASGAAVLTANADPFKQGLDQSSADLNKWGATTGKQLTSFGSQFRTSFTSMFAGGLGVGAGGAMASFGINAARSFGHQFMDQLNDIGKQSDMAKALGMTTAQFSGVAGLAKSFGEDTKEFIESLVTMGKLGSDAAAGIGEVAGPAFAALNLNAAQFIKLRPDQQFFAMFDALNKVGDGMKRTRLIMNAFGEDGGKLLLPLLSKSGKELRELAKGFEISEEAAKKAAATNEAYKKFSQGMNAAMRDLAVAAAPELTKAFGTLNTALKDNKDLIGDVAAGVGKFASFSAEVADMATSFGKTAKAMQEIKSLKEAESSSWLDDLPQTGREWGQSLAVIEGLGRVPETGHGGLDALVRAVGPAMRAGALLTNGFRWMAGGDMGIDGALDKANGTIKQGLPDRSAPWSQTFGAWGKEFDESVKQIADVGQAFAADWKKAAADVAASKALWEASWISKMDVSSWGGNFSGIGKFLKDIAPANPWHGGITAKEAGPKFADAIEQGSREATQREFASKYGGPWSKGSEAKQQVDELKKLDRKMERLIKAVENNRLMVL
jgi:hypothetical protein